METITIERCEKRPGVFVGARTYTLILNDEGLFLLELGKAMGHSNKSTALSDAILKKIQEKREEKHAVKEQEFSTKNLHDLVDNKKSFLVKKQDIKSVAIANLEFVPKLSINANSVKITLHFDQSDKEKVEKIYAYLN